MKLAREFKRANKALIKLGLPDEAKNEAGYDRAIFLLTVTKPESLPDAGDLIHIATRLAAIPRNMQPLLFSIGARLKKSKLELRDVEALRGVVKMVTFAAVAGEPAPFQINFPECDLMEADHKGDILSMLNNALDYVSRPRLVH
ncbi:MAG TPA: hypothetical protein VIE66_17750 [Methylocella sp.]